jgi:uncharacterized membrane protein
MSIDDLDAWLALVHVLAAMIWVGGVVVLFALALQTLRHPADGAVGRFVASLRVIGPALVAPAPAILVAAGIWAALNEDSSLFGRRWIQLGLGLFTAAFLVGAVHNSRAAIAAERADGAGDHAEAARQLRRWIAGSAVIVGLLLLATWDMVFKPGA